MSRIDFSKLWNWTWNAMRDAALQRDTRPYSKSFSRFNRGEAWVIILFGWIIIAVSAIIVLIMVWCVGMMLFNLAVGISNFLLQGNR